MTYIKMFLFLESQKFQNISSPLQANLYILSKFPTMEKIPIFIFFFFWAEKLSHENQVDFLLLEVAYLVWDLDRIFWLACLV